MGFLRVIRISSVVLFLAALSHGQSYADTEISAANEAVIAAAQGGDFSGVGSLSVGGDSGGGGGGGGDSGYSNSFSVGGDIGMTYSNGVSDGVSYAAALNPDMPASSISSTSTNFVSSMVSNAQSSFTSVSSDFSTISTFGTYDAGSSSIDFGSFDGGSTISFGSSSASIPTSQVFSGLDSALGNIELPSGTTVQATFDVASIGTGTTANYQVDFIDNQGNTVATVTNSGGNVSATVEATVGNDGQVGIVSDGGAVDVQLTNSYGNGFEISGVKEGDKATMTFENGVLSDINGENVSDNAQISRASTSFSDEVSKSEAQSHAEMANADMPEAGKDGVNANSKENALGVDYSTPGGTTNDQTKVSVVKGEDANADTKADIVNKDNGASDVKAVNGQSNDKAAPPASKADVQPGEVQKPQQQDQKDDTTNDPSKDNTPTGVQNRQGRDVTVISATDAAVANFANPQNVVGLFFEDGDKVTKTDLGTFSPIVSNNGKTYFFDSTGLPGKGIDENGHVNYGESYKVLMQDTVTGAYSVVGLGAVSDKSIDGAPSKMDTFVEAMNAKGYDISASDVHNPTVVTESGITIDHVYDLMSGTADTSKMYKMSDGSTTYNPATYDMDYAQKCYEKSLTFVTGLGASTSEKMNAARASGETNMWNLLARKDLFMGEILRCSRNGAVLGSDGVLEAYAAALNGKIGATLAEINEQIESGKWGDIAPTQTVGRNLNIAYSNVVW